MYPPRLKFLLQTSEIGKACVSLSIDRLTFEQACFIIAIRNKRLEEENLKYVENVGKFNIPQASLRLSCLLGCDHYKMAVERTNNTDYWKIEEEYDPSGIKVTRYSTGRGKYRGNHRSGCKREGRRAVRRNGWMKRSFGPGKNGLPR